MNHSAILKQSKKYEKQMVAFLREIVAIPSESGQERRVIERIRREMNKLRCFDRVWTDPMGNLLARIGQGPRLIAIDAHVDTVGVGDPSEWKHDPYKGKVAKGVVYGRGAGDQKGAVPAMVYAGKIIKDLKMRTNDWSLLLTCTVMEEDCDGHCLLHLIGQEGLRPDVVIIGEPTDLAVYRGHRGRVEATITTHGVSAHAAHAEQGVNALYKMARILSDVEELNTRLAHDEFLGTGSVVASFIECTTPSLNAVPDSAKIYIDRRLTAGETIEIALQELRALPNIGDAEVELLRYDETSWRGYRAQQDKYFPTWVLPQDHALVQGTVAAVEAVTGSTPRIWRWGFSTNGVASMGRFGIPTVGFAPGLEELAHSTQEWVAVDDLVSATAVYSLLPEILAARADDLKRSD